MINFPFGTNEKLIILGVPILKHITVNKHMSVAYFGCVCINIAIQLFSCYRLKKMMMISVMMIWRRRMTRLVSDRHTEISG